MSKETEFTARYIVYKDGSIFDKKKNMFLIPNITLNSQHKQYLMYNVKPYGRVMAARLIMFFCGNHKYEKLSQMPNVLFVDGDVNNINYFNLSFKNG